MEGSRAMTFTEADLGWHAQPPSHLDLTRVRRDDESDDILADLEKVSTPITSDSGLLDLTFEEGNMLQLAPVVRTEMPSPTDVAAANFAVWGGGVTVPLQEFQLGESCARGSREETDERERGICKPKRGRKKSALVPSRFCHICARTQKSRKMYCANLKTSVKCRKSVCEPCFRELGWEFGGEGWVCPHCRGICGEVPRARCHIYTKTNEKRKALRRL